jgi:hypothetical protein
MSANNNFFQLKTANSSGDYLSLKKAKHVYKMDKNFNNNKKPNHLKEKTISSYILYNKGHFQSHVCGEVILFGTFSAAKTIGIGASDVEDFYKGKTITIMDGTAKGDVRLITAYNASTNVISVNTEFSVITDNTTVFKITDSPNVFPYNRVSTKGTSRPSIVSNGTMTAALTLASDSIPVHDYYKNLQIKITSGASIGKSSKITAYNAVSKVITVDPALTGTDNTSVYEIVMSNENTLTF